MKKQIPLAQGSSNTYLKQILIAFLFGLLAMPAQLLAQNEILVHYWNFNNTDALLETTSSLISAQTIVTELQNDAEVTSGTGQNFAGENARGGDPAGAHLRVNNPIGATITIPLPTTGFSDVVVKFETRRSGSGADTQNITYTINGSDFVALQTLTVTEVPTVITLDFSEVTGVADNADFAIRITFDDTNDPKNMAGNNRFDNITLEGVSAADENLPPVVSNPVSTQQLVAGGTFSVNLSTVFLDPDNDPLTFSASSSNASIASAELAEGNLTVTAVKPGNAVITVGANDGNNAEVTGSFSVLVYAAPFTFTDAGSVFTEDFAGYRGSEETLPDNLFLGWDQPRAENPFTGVGNFNTADPADSYGGFVAYTADDQNFSFGLRERVPVDMRDGRVFMAFTNNTSEPISEFEVSYDVEAWFVGNRRNRIRLKFDNTLAADGRETFETDIFSTDNPSESTTAGTKVDGSLAANRVTVSGTVDITTIDDGSGAMFAPIAPGQTFYFRWQKSNADGDGGTLRSGLAINNISITAVLPPVREAIPFSFTDDARIFTEDFAGYRGSEETLPDNLFLGWDQPRAENPFTGVGNFNTADPADSYGGFVAYTADDQNFSFGLRERVPVDMRDGRVFMAFTNNTSEPISEFEVSYDVEAWFVGNRRNRIRLKFDNTLAADGRETFETDIFSTDNPSESTTAGTKVDGSLAANRVTVSGTVDITTIDDGSGAMFAPIAPGQTFYFRWQKSNADGDGGTLRSGLAINNISITAIDPNETSIDSANDNVVEFALMQNYPNPFNPTTTIAFTLPESSEIRLTIFDMLGRKVATLADGVVSAGAHTVQFDASQLNSGIYIYRLEAGNLTTTRKMTLIK